MKITAEMDISAITVGEDEVLVLVFPEDSFPPPTDEEEKDPLEQLIEDFKMLGIGDRVFVICARGVQMAKIKK